MDTPLAKKQRVIPPPDSVVNNTPKGKAYIVVNLVSDSEEDISDDEVSNASVCSPLFAMKFCELKCYGYKVLVTSENKARKVDTLLPFTITI